MKEPEIKRYDDYFDPELCMVREAFISPGYHSRVASGTLVHLTRESLDYALELLLREDSASHERAIAIIEKVVPLQDQDPVSKTYGVWSWLYEEPLSEMDPPDWNWADFCGFRLAQIFLKAKHRLPNQLQQAVKEAMFHAAGSIYRRNMHPGYTNISIMGGIVTTLIGEILEESRMLSYGIRRLKQAADHHREQGGFSEYNSPTYTRVVLLDTAQALESVRNPEARGFLQYLFRVAWETIAHHFHPATGQWAGPHSRDYRPFLQPEMAYYIERKTGVKIKTPPPMPAKEFRSELHYIPGNPDCPADLIPCFTRLPQKEYEFKERYVRREADEASTWGTTWMHEEACLGSVSRDYFFDQRRAVLAYWNGSAGKPVALRLRFLHDDREFTSAYVRSEQSGTRVLSAVHLLLGFGDFHPFFYTHKNDTFNAKDFRMRYELLGEAVDAILLGDGRFRLSSGDWCADITPASGSFGDAPVKWKITRGEGWVAVDAVCYEGPAKDVPFRELSPVVLAAGLHLHKLTEESRPIPIQTELREDSVHSSYGGMDVTVPDHAVPLP